MKRIIFIFLFTTSVTAASAQSVVGFWEIKEVTVGNEFMTPIARWTRINQDGTYQSGNGWQQNSEGTWDYDNKSNSFLPKETNGIEDSYGAFKVSFSGKEMIWQRKEDAMTVTVTLTPIKKLPKSTADEIKGLWDLTDALLNSRSVKDKFDPDDIYYVFIRWDRIYIERSPEGKRSTGYWYINAHRPEITFISHTAGQNPESWQIEVNDLELKLKGISETNKNRELIFQRINEFPQ
ncbi:hypothetical protein GM418_00560 [Maribellus comscasis]|uniref:Lipocalin-like domain-containing protein n=1 Tax=Maribellus comscasis TaxID=2681766 RepID=A0A6I6JMC2_9BACT|nr:hypothetical protein [Maribellus comscasis]QGY42198.1 hypothetical protein GM418_00560 [Maribellus comscasis]